MVDRIEPPLVKGGQGRTGDDIIRDACAWLMITALLVAVFAGGALCLHVL